MIIAMNNYLYLSNKTYKELEEYIDIFEKESIVIDRFKCLLLREEEIDDFSVNGNSVNVYKNNNEYTLLFDNLTLQLFTKDKMIMSYQLKR